MAVTKRLLNGYCNKGILKLADLHQYTEWSTITTLLINPPNKKETILGDYNSVNQFMIIDTFPIHNLNLFLKIRKKPNT